MTNVQQFADDLHFVRKAVEQDQGGAPRSANVMWAIYVLVCYTMIDFAPVGWTDIVFLAGGVLCVGGSIALHRRHAQTTGQITRNRRRAGLGMLGAFVIIVATGVAMQLLNPSLRGTPGGQIMVIMVGFMYFLSGVYGPPRVQYLTWAGPIVIAGGVCVSLVPRYGWTCLGILIAACILLPVFRKQDAAHA